MAVVAVQEPTGLSVDNATSASKAFSGNVTAGNLVIVQCWRYNGGANTAFLAANCTKTAGTATIGTITLDKQSNVGGSNPCQSGIWSVPITGTGSLTMAVAGAAGSFFGLTVGEYSGLDVSGTRVENTNASTATSATTPGVTGNAASANGGLLCACIAVDTSNATSAMVVGNSFTKLFQATDGSTHQVGESDRRILSSGVTTQGTWTIVTLGLLGWAACIVAYKIAGGGGSQGALLSDKIFSAVQS